MISPKTRLIQGLLGHIPKPLRDELLSAYSQIVKNYRERRWGPSELDAGKFCEVAYTILRGHIDGSYPSKPMKPNNMVDACRSLEQASSSRFSRSIRIQIPRMLMALYEIRNNRGVGHVGGDVDPNLMDATCTLHGVKWVLAELVRVFHNIDPVDAATAIEDVVARVLPIVWEVQGRFRVLDTSLTMKDKVLLLLYHNAGPVAEQDFCSWVEHSNPSAFRRDVLRRAHRERLLEYEEESQLVWISPKGIEHVEATVLVQL